MTDPLSLCPHCNCMTKTIDYQCGKCKAGKDPLTEKRLREFDEQFTEDGELLFNLDDVYADARNIKQFLIDTIRMVREENES